MAIGFADEEHFKGLVGREGGTCRRRPIIKTTPREP